ncbi:MAG: hypothetical protein PUC59_06365 [Firmicutes bacterium]|nr:hypothetical protein [Bacillota bacterium]
MRRFLCVFALVLAAVMLMAGCEAAGTFSQAESVPVQTSIPESEPESRAESAPEPKYPRPYTTLTGKLAQELPIDRFWYFEALLGDNLGYLDLDGKIVWNTTTAASREAVQKFRQEHPWVDTGRKISTFFGDGSGAIAEGKVLGHGESWWQSENDPIGKLIANWEKVWFLQLDESLVNSGVPVAYGPGGVLRGIELEEQTGQKTVFQEFVLQQNDFVMGVMEAHRYQESGCDYGILTGLTAKGTLKAVRIPLALGLNTESIEKVMQGGDGETALPLPDYAIYDGVVSVQDAGFTLSDSLMSAKLILRKNGTLLCDDGAGNLSVVARRIVKMARGGLRNAEDGRETAKLLIDEENCVIRLSFSEQGETYVPSLESVGFCSDWTKIVSVQRGYAVKNDGTVERIDRTGSSEKTFFEDITDIKALPKPNG